MSKQTRRCRCPRCGGIFFTEYPTKVYCDRSCARSANNARRWAKKKEARRAVPGS